MPHGQVLVLCQRLCQWVCSAEDHDNHWASTGSLCVPTVWVENTAAETGGGHRAQQAHVLALDPHLGWSVWYLCLSFFKILVQWLGDA